MSRDAPDVVVIGGGVIGCAVGYYLARAGVEVTLVDRPRRGRATSASAGGLWPLGESLGLGCGVIFYKALAGSVPEGAPRPLPPSLPDCFLEFSLKSNELFPDLDRELRELGTPDMEYEETSLLFLTFDEGDVAFARYLLESAPIDRSLTRWIEPDELARAEPALNRDNRGALQFLGDNQVNPYRLADGLREGARIRGATVLTHTDVIGITTRDRRVVAVETTAGTIPCRYVVNAAGSWAGEVGRMAGVRVPVHPVRGQIVCTETLPEVLSACVSTSDCYLCQKKNGEIIIGSTTETADFDPGVTRDALHELAAGAVRTLPFLDRVHVKRTWSGFRPGSPDELPILGPVPELEGYINACGHFRTGILNAPLTGLLLARWIRQEPLPVPIEPFLLERFAGAREATGSASKLSDDPAADTLARMRQQAGVEP